MPDIFQRETSSLGGVFTADRTKLSLKGGLGVLVQQMQVTYAQSINRLYEVGAPSIYYVGGRTQGQLTIGRVIGPTGSVCEIYSEYGDVCKAKGNIINLTLEETDCSEGGEGTGKTRLILKGCVITQIGISVQAQDMIINENLAMMFSSLECS
jgi:hypothetical protein